MRDDRPSRTAEWVAAARGLGGLLPDGGRLIEDQFGARFAGRSAALARLANERFPRWTHPVANLIPRSLLRGALWIQLRTRVLDDALLTFIANGGGQVLLLGAGYDCRAWRFSDQLSAATVFEVDHPATQARKRRILDELGASTSRVRFLSWNFEQRRMDELPRALAAIGHDPTRPTLTIWEGVTPYLTADAIDASVTAVRALSAIGSTLAFSYFDTAQFERPTLLARLVRSVGEPFRFGWDPAQLGAWLAQRGFVLTSDRSEADLARELLPPSLARIARTGRHVALARSSR